MVKTGFVRDETHTCYLEVGAMLEGTAGGNIAIRQIWKC